jgi:D-tyrosyl-tRNA(Tyr) deacylase
LTVELTVGPVASAHVEVFSIRSLDPDAVVTPNASRVPSGENAKSLTVPTNGNPEIAAHVLVL